MKTLKHIGRQNLFIAIGILALFFSPSPVSAHTEENNKSTPSGSVDGVQQLPDSKNQILKLTDDGLEPRTVRMRKEDSILFFLNDTTDSLATLSIDFGKRIVHCGGGNLRANDQGQVTTTYPIEPKNFATTCFHEPGTYPFRVFGLKNRPGGVEASVIVE